MHCYTILKIEKYSFVNKFLTLWVKISKKHDIFTNKERKKSWNYQLNSEQLSPFGIKGLTMLV